MCNETAKKEQRREIAIDCEDLEEVNEYKCFRRLIAPGNQLNMHGDQP